MILELKNRIEKELASYIKSLNKDYFLDRLSPVLYRTIREFISRKGKRLRPILFTIGYLGYAKKIARGLYRSAISIELLHDFMLVHDDIIDKSDVRRGKPSMHALLNRYLRGKNNIKFSGEDLTIVAGDVMFALAMHAFLSIKENKERKEKALQKLIEAALYTGSGEFIEILYGIKDLGKITKKDIYATYDFKTANYTFASPLSIGATLAGAGADQAKRIFKYGIYLGRAFQIKDDILGMFGSEKEIGKSNLSDLKEAKKTILIWHAYNNANTKNKSALKRIFRKTDINKNDLLEVRSILRACGTLDYVKSEVDGLITESQDILNSLKMRTKYKNILKAYTNKLLYL